MEPNSAHEFGAAVPPTLPRECKGSSPCNTEILSLAALRREYVRGSSNVTSASSPAARASGWVGPAALTAAPSSMKLTAAPASETLESVVVREADSTPIAGCNSVFFNATAAPIRASQPCESVSVDISTAAVSLESSSSATTSPYLSFSPRTFLRITATPPEDGGIQRPPAAVPTVAEAHLERHVGCPCMDDNATATIYSTNSPPAPIEQVDSADRGASAAAMAAHLLRPQGNQLSLSRCMPRTTPSSQGRRPAQATGVITPTNSHKAPFPLPAPTTTSAAAAMTRITAIPKGIASSSAALATHQTAHGNTANNTHGTPSCMFSVPPPFHTALRQQSQLSFVSSQSLSGRLDASPTPTPRSACAFPTVAATHTTTTAASGSLASSSKMQLSSLCPTISPAATISRAPSVVPSPMTSEVLMKRTYSTASSLTYARHSRLAPPPPFPGAKPDATISDKSPLSASVAVTARTGAAVDAVGYRECERDILWRVLARFFAALLLPHTFMWYVMPALLLNPAKSASAEAAALPRVHLHAVSRNHPEVTLFALELFVVGLVCWSLVRLRQISNPKSSREHHGLYSGLHTCSISMAASPSIKVAGVSSVAGDPVAERAYTWHPSTISKQSVADAALSTVSPRLSSRSRKMRLRALRNPSTGSSSNAGSSGHAHRILSNPPAPLQSLLTGPLANPRSMATTIMRAATSGATTPVRDLENVSRCPSGFGSSIRRAVSNTGGEIVSDPALGGGGSSSSTMCTTTPSVSPRRWVRLTSLTPRETSHAFGKAHSDGSPVCPVADSSAIATWPNASDTEESRPQEALIHSYNRCAIPWDVPPSQQQTRERFSGNGARCLTGFPASPITPLAYSYTSPFSALPSVRHASLALTGLGSPARGKNGTVALHSPLMPPTEAASAARNDPCLLSSTGAATASFAYSPSIGRDGHVPTMTHFGLGLGFLVCTGLATWRLSLDYYFACYSFELDTNAALWLWLIPVSLLATAAYVALLIGGHTLRRRALRQLQDANRLGSSQGEEEQEEAAHRVAAAAAMLRRLRWMAWCLAFVPYPQQDAALFVDAPESIMMRPDAASPSSGSSMFSGFAVKKPYTTLSAVSLTFTASSVCDGGDDAADDNEVSAAVSALLRQSSMSRLDDDKDRKEVAISDAARRPAHNVLHLTREITKGQCTPVVGAPGGEEGLATAGACGSFAGASLRAFTPSLMPSRTTTARSTLSYRGKYSNFSHQTLRTLGQRLQRLLATVHISTTLRAWRRWASHQLHIPDFLLRLHRLYSFKQQQHRAEWQRRQRTRVPAPVERQLWTWRPVELFSLERVMVWTYLLMLFFFFQAMCSLVYFTWAWRRIAREAAMATMYAADTANTATPAPPSFAAYSCTNGQLYLRNVLWFIPPFCVGHGDSASSPHPSTTWSMPNQVALLLILLGQRRFEMAYLYTNVALPIGFVSTLYLFLHEVWIHLKSRRVLRLLALAKSRVETARKVREAML